jgi:uracil phosphoribosyltransferase
MNKPLIGSYPEHDCIFLLKKLKPKFHSIEKKEKLIQSGQLHYSQMVSQESKPTPEYEKLFHTLTAKYKHKLAQEILHLSHLISKNIKRDICIVSLVRAGTPIGVLVNKGINKYSHYKSIHYSISIVRDKGIDVNALDYLIFDLKIAPESIVFIDGWTAKGIITKELKQAVAKYNASRKVSIGNKLYVVSDIGGTADYSVTFDDYAIPSALMNSTVSGLISRSVINEQVGESDFHGCISYKHLAQYDLSNWFVSEVSECFLAIDFKSTVTSSEKQKIARYSLTQEYITQLMIDFSISDINRIKPGIAEATRVMLRRVPDLLLVNNNDNPNTAHLIRIATEKNIRVVVLPEMPFGACALIKDVGK